MNGIRNYQDLTVWQKAMDLVTEIYRISKTFPKEELYGLTNQMRRAAVSIPSNIAEGHARKSRVEYVNFLSIAQGSRAELETQLLIAVRLRYLTKEDAHDGMALLDEIGRMITTIKQKLNPP